MKFIKQLCLLFILITAVSACTVPGAEETATTNPIPTSAPQATVETVVPPTDDNSLADTAWTLISFGPDGAETAVLDETAVTLMFDTEGRAGGSGGCNSFGTDYQVQGSTLIFGEIVSTLMACMEADVTEQEQRYLTALRAVEEFEQTDDQLILRYDQGQNVLNFVASDAVSATPSPAAEENSLVGTQWRLESFGPTTAEMPIVEGSVITLEFETAVQAGGSGGCNSYGGEYTVQGDTITFGQTVSTLIACADENVTEQEQQYFTALQMAESFMQTAESLTILYNNGQSTLNFVPVTSSDEGSSLENPIRIAFASGETSAEIEGIIAEEPAIQFYVLGAFEGQEMTVEITSPNNDVLLTIVGEDGIPIKRYQVGPPSWTGNLPATQDYYIYAVSVGSATPYTLYVQIDPP